MSKATRIIIPSISWIGGPNSILKLTTLPQAFSKNYKTIRGIIVNRRYIGLVREEAKALLLEECHGAQGVAYPIVGSQTTQNQGRGLSVDAFLLV